MQKSSPHTIFEIYFPHHFPRHVAWNLYYFQTCSCECINIVNSWFCNIMSAACGVKIRGESLSRAKWKGTQPLISTRVGACEWNIISRFYIVHIPAHLQCCEAKQKQISNIYMQPPMRLFMLLLESSVQLCCQVNYAFTWTQTRITRPFKRIFFVIFSVKLKKNS